MASKKKKKEKNVRDRGRQRQKEKLCSHRWIHVDVWQNQYSIVISL